MILIGAKRATVKGPARATFRVKPSMTKHEIKEYLNKVYGLPVKQVNTQNWMGKRQVLRGLGGVIYRKNPDYKKAIVRLGDCLPPIKATRMKDSDKDDRKEASKVRDD
jgi:large subunit ribosomal protein L23